VRFYGEEDDVKTTTQPLRFNEVAVPGNSHLTIQTDYSESVASQFSQARAVVHECHGVAFVRECSTKQAANGACAQHAD
jgi:hypothetical protein